LIGQVDESVVGTIAQEAASQTNRVCQIANINSPLQIVISGNEEAVDKAIEISKTPEYKRKIRKIQKLQVSAPFHCSLMKDAQTRLEDYILEKSKFFQVKFEYPTRGHVESHRALGVRFMTYLGSIRADVRRSGL